MTKKGKLIAFEGTDGSGKKTQSEMLKKFLEDKGFSIAMFGFPRYGEPSAKWVERYLNNELGDAVTMDPYLASMFFSIDRRENAKKINDLLEKYDFVIIDRYSASNAGHQGGKLKDEEKRKQFVDWLYKTEHVFFEVPRPDLVIIPHVSANVSQINVGKKEKRSYLKDGTHDAHEENIGHLEDARSAFLWLAEQYSKNHVVIECMEGDKLLSLEKVHQKVLGALKEKQLI